MEERKPVTAPSLVAMKARGERIVTVTAYDYPTALYADRAGVDVILVGDTLGMVVLGYETTLPVTMDDMLLHVRAVRRANPKALVVADMPFMSYQAGEDDAVRNAGRMLKEGGAAAVKLEGGERVAATVERLAGCGIPVMGHLGMTPQSFNEYGGFKVQARKPEAAARLLRDARILQEAGAFAIVLELIPAEVAAAVTGAVTIPTIGIGAGPACDGQVQVLHDLLGLFDWFAPRHAKRYAEVGDTIRQALAQYAADVRAGTFPADENSFHEPELRDPGTWS